MLNWMEMHAERAEIEKSVKALDNDLKAAKKALKDLDGKVLAELKEQEERGESGTKKMGDGTSYTRYSIEPWKASGESGAAVKKWLVEHDHLIMIGAPKMAELKTHFSRLGEEPPEELDVHIQRTEVFKLSVTKGKK
jgi:hypothetical protein